MMMMSDWIEIDGAFGEGGGQILRSSLTLSLLTGRPLTMVNIRAKRKKPGLLRQHLTAVAAAKTIGDAQVEGETPGSSRLRFIPNGIRAGEYEFRIGTAGSATLVLQTILPALALANGPSVVRLFGGTENPMAPPFDHLATTFLPLLNRMGPSASAELRRHGFFPAGGGEIVVRITSCEKFAPLTILTRNEPLDVNATVRVAQLPEHIAQRELATLAKKSEFSGERLCLDRVTDSAGPGNVVLITAKSESITETFSAFGQVGITAERVAKNALNQYEHYAHSSAPVGIYTADQLILPMAIAAYQGNGGSAFRTLPLSEHSRTHLHLIDRFLGIKPRVTQEESETVRVEF